MIHHRRDETKAAVRLAETGIVSAAHQLVNRLAVAIGRKAVAQRVHRHPERIDLPPRKLLDSRSVRPHAVGVAGLHVHHMAISTGHRRNVVEPMTRVDPTVEVSTKRVVHSVRVPLEAHWTVQPDTFVRAVISIGISQQPDVGNAIHDRPALNRDDADRNIQAIGKRRDLVRSAVPVGVFQDLDAVATRFVERHGKRVLGGIGDPQSAALVKGDVHRLEDIGFRRNQLDFESGRQAKTGQLLPRAKRLGGAYVGLERILSAGGTGRADCHGEPHSGKDHNGEGYRSGIPSRGIPSSGWELKTARRRG